MSKKLPSEFSHAFSGQIWRMYPDLPARKIALEIRSPEQHSVSYAIIDAEAPAVEHEHIDAGTGWYGGLLAICGNYLIIHGYGERPDPSEEDKIVVISVSDGEILWEIEHVRFLSFTDFDKVMIFSTVEEGGPRLEVDLKSGEMNYLDENALPPGSTEEINNTKDLRLPLHYPEENAHYTSLARLVAELTGHQAIKEIEYAEWGECVVISYYLYRKNSLDNFLLIIDKEGNTLSHVILSEGLQGLASDSFFLLDQKLFFVKNKNILCVYDQ